MCKINLAISYRVYSINSLTSITNRSIYNQKFANRYTDNVIYVN